MLEASNTPQNARKAKERSISGYLPQFKGLPLSRISKVIGTGLFSGHLSRFYEKPESPEFIPSLLIVCMEARLAIGDDAGSTF